ncbi:hypothetical protein ACFYKX_13295 [Cytobacillus sp. FJAT-54145]|uniref:Uncharacterized protein n=1 Tax=Cytobacillus spartinae TaxID=3299023 RepID=A0ABW6KFG4_9BACI
MATKIIFLLIPWITPVIFLLSAQIAVDYGVHGLLGFSIMGAISFIAIFFLQRKAIFSKFDDSFKNFLYSLYVIELCICISIVIEIIIKESFYYFFSIINVLFIIVATVVFIFLQRINEKLSISIVISGLIFSFLIPTLVYLKVSIPTVYSGLHFLATDMLKFNDRYTWLLVVTLGIILIAHQYLYHMFYYKGLDNQRAFTYLISSMVWLVVPISLGSLAFLAKAQAVWPDLSDQVSIMVINRFGGQFGQMLFLVTSIFIIITLVTRMLKDFRKRSQFKGSLWLFVHFILPVIVAFSFKITLLQVIIVFGLVWGPILGVVLGGSNMRKINILGVIIGFSVSSTLSIIYSLPIGILLGTAVSCFILRLVNYLSFHQSKATA